MKNEKYKYLPEGHLLGTDKNREIFASPASLQKAIDEGTVAEGRALLCDRAMDLRVELPLGRGILPKREIAYCESGSDPKDISVITRVGKPVAFTIKSALPDGTLLLSRRDAQRRCWSEYLSSLSVGDIIPATVTHLEPFGAFLDIGCGYPALMSVDSISVSRISHPSDRLCEGDRIYCAVRSVDADRRRIFVSQRELLGTWEENASLFSSGQTVRGIIRSVEDYGIFVELTPNLAGLAELRSPISDPASLIGRFASVYIKSILPARMKIKLVLIEALERCPSPVEQKYFIDCEKVSHIDRWQYSPAGASKNVFTDFCQ